MFKLRELPFNKANHAFISETTCDYHHGKHHATYINNLNNLIKDSEFKNADLLKIIQESNGGLFNNAAQVYNHDFYWDCVAKKSEASEDLKNAIKEEFGEDFKDKFLKSAATFFGSGWCWLVYNPQTKKLEIVQTSNAGTPIKDNKIPLLVVDVWEHAYYVDFYNARPNYLEKFYENINWEFVSSAYEWAKKEGMGSVKFYIDGLYNKESSCCGGSC